MATDAQAAASAKAIRDALISEVQTETAAWVLAGGPKPNYSLDGQSVSWNEWLSNRTDQIEKMNKLIQILEGPWMVVSRAST